MCVFCKLLYPLLQLKFRATRIILCIGLIALNYPIASSLAQENYRVLVLTERGGQHGPFTETALVWLAQTAEQNGFSVEEINNTQQIDSAYLAHFNLFIQLDYPPYTWSKKAEAAFIDYIEKCHPMGFRNNRIAYYPLI